jgi:8-oxo-dGTP pyrophosphatase MutT (NUDIX family)
VVHRAPVGHWARATDEMVWGLCSSVRMTASMANDNGVRWPFTERRASVLVCLFEGAAGELRVILTRRAGRLSSHSGEVALPGGKRDEEDEDDIATALREAKEEIGLEPSQVRVVAIFEPFLSKVLSQSPWNVLCSRRSFLNTHWNDFNKNLINWLFGL